MQSLSIIITSSATIKDYFLLLKPRVMSLVVFTGVVGIYLAPGEISYIKAILATFCLALGCGASGAFNMWYERDTDALMQRTQNRPIPSGKVPPNKALFFAIICALISVYLMAISVNYVAASTLAIAILFYSIIYTVILKTRTPQNIVIGGAAGAMPPIVGWASVSGEISIDSIILFLIIFTWTPPHFWALALYRSDDYSKVGIPMLPNVAGKQVTKKSILIYTFMLFLISLLPFFLANSGVIYLLAAIIFGGCFLWKAFRLYYRCSDYNAKKMFAFSIIYLFAIFCFLVVDKGIS